MAALQKNNPLHGVTLEQVLQYLVEKYGWEELGSIIRINCFNEKPSIQSSLKFLRKTPWARKKVEDLYVCNLEKNA
ncbi:MAG: VF530 family protein [Ferruginibacter sp.]